MNESEFQNFYNLICPRDSEITSIRGFVKIDTGQMGGTHWTCFNIENIKSFCFDLCGEQPDKFLLNQLSKPMLYHNY